MEQERNKKKVGESKWNSKERMVEWKRKLQEQEADKRYYKSSITKEAVSIAAYEKNILDAAGIMK